MRNIKTLEIQINSNLKTINSNKFNYILYKYITQYKKEIISIRKLFDPPPLNPFIIYSINLKQIKFQIILNQIQFNIIKTYYFQIFQEKHQIINYI